MSGFDDYFIFMFYQILWRSLNKYHFISCLNCRSCYVLCTSRAQFPINGAFSSWSLLLLSPRWWRNEWFLQCSLLLQGQRINRSPRCRSWRCFRYLRGDLFVWSSWYTQTPFLELWRVWATDHFAPLKWSKLYFRCTTQLWDSQMMDSCPKTRLSWKLAQTCWAPVGTKCWAPHLN